MQLDHLSHSTVVPFLTSQVVANHISIYEEFFLNLLFQKDIFLSVLSLDQKDNILFRCCTTVEVVKDKEKKKKKKDDVKRRKRRKKKETHTKTTTYIHRKHRKHTNKKTRTSSNFNRKCCQIFEKVVVLPNIFCDLVFKCPFVTACMTFPNIGFLSRRR